MVEMALQLHHVFLAPLAVIGLSGLPGLHEPGPQAGGRRTRAVARAHGQQAAFRAFHEFVHQHTGQGSTGGGHQLRLRIGGVHGQAAHEVGRGGRRQGDLTMGTGDAAPEPGQRTGRHPLHAQLVQRPAGAQDVHQGVHGAHFMEMHLFRGDAVGLGFGQGQGLQHGQGLVAHPVGHRHGGKNGGDVRRVPQGLALRLPADLHPAAGTAAPLFLPDLQPAGHARLCQQARQGGKVHTKMGKGGQGHVPAHAVTAIKEKMLHLIMTPL